MEIRRQLAPYFFPNPVEGTQHIEKDGFEAALQHKLTYKLDEAALDAVMPQMPEHYRNLGVLVKYKPSLVLDGYRALDTELRLMFDQALTISEGAPTLDIKRLVPGGVVATVAGGVMHHIPDVAAHKQAAVLRENNEADEQANREHEAHERSKKKTAKTKAPAKKKKK